MTIQLKVPAVPDRRRQPNANPQAGLQSGDRSRFNLRSVAVHLNCGVRIFEIGKHAGRRAWNLWKLWEDVRM